MLTNRHGLPAPLVNAIRNDPYTKGQSDISVTTLIQPPQPRKLLGGREVTEDASDLIWRLLGQAVHAILERAYPDTAIVEQRLFAEVLGWTVSGQFDVYDQGCLSDYKITSVYAHGKVKPEWEGQLNLLAALCRRNSMPVRKLEIVAIFRDWRPREAMLADDYPPAQVGVIPVELWTAEEAEHYLEQRVTVHQMDDPPPCTDEERWMVPAKWALMQGQVDQWALMQEGKKRAVRLYEDKPEIALKPGQYWDLRPGEAGKRALRLFDGKPDIKLGRGQYLEYRPGAYRRCEDYCAAASICPQWRLDREFAGRDPNNSAKQEDVADAPGLLETDPVAG